VSASVERRAMEGSSLRLTHLPVEEFDLLRPGRRGVYLIFGVKRDCHGQLLLRSIRPSKVIANAFKAALT
jgi:hypothetical protein